MENISKHSFTEEEKEKSIEALIPQLLFLRARAGVTQDELSGIIGISRQSYSSIERGIRRPSWNTFLSLVMYFDYNQRTHKLLHNCGAFPDEFVKAFNALDYVAGASEINLEPIFGKQSDMILKSLDEQAIKNIKTMILMEQERCKRG